MLFLLDFSKCLHIYVVVEVAGVVVVMSSVVVTSVVVVIASVVVVIASVVVVVVDSIIKFSLSLTIQTVVTGASVCDTISYTMIAGRQFNVCYYILAYEDKN